MAQDERLDPNTQLLVQHLSAIIAQLSVDLAMARTERDIAAQGRPEETPDE